MDDLVNIFMDITGCKDPKVARVYIQRNRNHLNNAIDEFYRYGSSFQSERNKDGITSHKNALHSAELNKLFDKYAEPTDLNQMGINGTIAYLTDLNIDFETDVRAIILAYILESPSAGVFKRDLFVKNWNKANVSMLENMPQYLRSLESNNEVMNQVHKFAFKYALEPGKRKLPVEDCVQLWRVLYNKELENVDTTASRFVNEFISSGKSGKENISRDEWDMSRPFFSINLDDLVKHSEDSAWPVLMDEFVESLFDQNYVST